MYFAVYNLHCCQVSEIMQNNSKGAAKKSFGGELFEAVEHPMLVKSSRKGARTHFLPIISFFRGSLNRK